MVSAPRGDPSPAPFDLVDEVDVAGLKVAVVRAALELDLFEKLRLAPRSEASLAAELNGSPDGVGILVRALMSLELLRRDAAGMLHNTPTAEAYLTSGADSAFAPILLSWFRNRDQLADVIRGRASAKDHSSDTASRVWRAYAAPDLVRWPATVDTLSSTLAERHVTVPNGGRVLDLGCGSALIGLTLVRHVTGAVVVAVDRPEVLAVAEALASGMGLSDRLEQRPGDVREVQLEPAHYDVALLTNVAQYLDDRDLAATLNRVRAALRPDGVLQLVTPRVDDGVPGSAVNWTTAIEMYLSSPGVPLRDEAAVRRAVGAAGFASVESFPPNAYVCRPGDTANGHGSAVEPPTGTDFGGSATRFPTP